METKEQIFINIKLNLIGLSVLLSASVACNSDEHIHPKSFDIIISAGQSNTLAGKFKDNDIDLPENRIYQLGRQGLHHYQIIDANEPLEHHSKRVGQIGHALVFSKLYKNNHLPYNKDILIIPCGKGGTGFITKHWNPGDTLYTDLLKQVNRVLYDYPGSEVKVVLWQQGESDTKNEFYQANLDSLIQSLRNDLKLPDLPFLLGGMAPDWIDNKLSRKKINDIIKSTPNRFQNLKFVDPEYPTRIQKTIDQTDTIHYDAYGQRELGERYYIQYMNLINQ